MSSSHITVTLSPLDLFSSKDSFSATKKPRRFSRFSSLRKRGRGKKKRLESEIEASELNHENNDEVTTEKDDRSGEIPESCAVNTPEATLSRSNEDAPNIYFSDDDEDMNVDFDMDIDTDEDIVRNEENDGDGDTTVAAPAILDVQDVTKQDNDSSDAKKSSSSPNKQSTAADPEETMDTDAGNHVEREDHNSCMDVANRSSSAVLNTGKINLVTRGKAKGSPKSLGDII